MPHDIDTKEDIFNKEIIDTFFGKKKEKKFTERPLSPRPKHKHPRQKRNLALIAIAIGVAFLSLALISFIILQRLSHKKSAASIYPSRTYLKLLENGVFNRSIVSSFSFKGDAKEQSVILQNHIKLVNSGKLGWARISCDLTEPQDFSNVNLLILARSQHAAKSLLVLMDADGNGHLIPLKLSPKWEWKSVSLEELRDINLKKIKSISIEYGFLATRNANGTTVYIKEIGLRAAKAE